MPENNVSMSFGKHRMADCYLSGAVDKPHRILLFQSLTKYAENVVQVYNGDSIGSFACTHCALLGGSDLPGRGISWFAFRIFRFFCSGKVADIASSLATLFGKGLAGSHFYEQVAPPPSSESGVGGSYRANKENIYRHGYKTISTTPPCTCTCTRITDPPGVNVYMCVYVYV